MSRKPLRVTELFAGVGGFRIALEGYPKQKNSGYKVVFSNQYEPKTKKQHANIVYKNRWKDGCHSETSIEDVVENDFTSIPNHDLLVGGFPCQDFSIANRSHNRGLEGTKGKLWWSIIDILKKKGKQAPKYLFFENVDRLLLSPSKQRGRDFAVILSSLDALGYAIEWRVINAADYGFPQRRRRVYILGYKKGTKLYQSVKAADAENYLLKGGVMANAFPCIVQGKINYGSIPTSIKDCMLNFSNENNRFEKAGCMIDGKYHSIKVKTDFKGKHQVLKDVLLNKKSLLKDFIIPENVIPKWQKEKSAKVKTGISKNTGKPYIFKEGNVPFPDSTDRTARTILTKEGGSYASREKHVVKTKDGYRRLHPIELERLNGFPDDFTKCEGITDCQRAFFMGNALVIDVVQKIGNELTKKINSCK